MVLAHISGGVNCQIIVVCLKCALKWQHGLTCNLSFIDTSMSMKCLINCLRLCLE